MRAFKFLDAHGATVFTANTWPLPRHGQPGAWVEASSVRPCREGIHACTAGDLAYWINEELWEIELDGEIQEAHRKVVARRGRIVRRIDGWAGGVAAAFPVWCAWRGRDRAVDVFNELGLTPWAQRLSAAVTLGEVASIAKAATAEVGEANAGGAIAALAGDAAALASHLGVGAFIVACAAGHAAARVTSDRAGYAAAFAAERRAQSHWIAAQLELM